MQTNCIAYAKIVQNKKLQTLRLLVTFDSSKKDKNGNIIVSVANAAFNSGDMCNDDAEDYVLQNVINKQLALVQATLRTDNVQFV